MKLSAVLAVLVSAALSVHSAVIAVEERATWTTLSTGYLSANVTCEHNYPHSMYFLFPL